MRPGNEALSRSHVRAFPSVGKRRAVPTSDRGFKSFPDKKRPLFVPHELIVGYKPGVTRAARAATRSVMGARLREPLGVPDVEVVELDNGVGVRDAVAAFEAHPLVDYAEPNYIYSISAVSPNDTRFSELWGLNNTGQTIEGTTGVADADIDAAEAWDITTGSATVEVAVVDTGVASGHPDLSSNMTSGWDFIQNDAVAQDEHGHGTHVAGTIGARGNDGVGVAGINWDVTLIPVRVFGAKAQTSNDIIVSGMQYAVDQGADVVNLSLGGPGRSQAMANVISNAPNVLFVAAAGNGDPDRIGDNNDAAPQYPCNFSSANVICVAASDSADRLTGFSNYGSTSVDLAAPGEDILSAAPAAATAFFTGFEEDVVPFSTGGTSPWGFELDPYGYYATDSPYALYANNADSWIDSEPFSLSGKSGCKLNYALYLDTELDYDGLVIEATTDGVNYQPLGGWTGWSDTWVLLSQDLSAYDGLPQVGISFRLVSDATTRRDGAYVDDVSIDCAAASFTGDDFVYMRGTSMATPHVAGAAALMLAANPNATVAQLRSALLQGVDKKSSLSTKVASGGRLNLFNSLQLIAGSASPTPTPTPVPTSTSSVTPMPTGSATPSSSPSPEELDIAAPGITNVSDRPDPFSPNGDGYRDKVRIAWTLGEAATTSLEIFNRYGTRVRNFGSYLIDAGDWFYKWNGRNNSGRRVRSGTYTYVITARDAAGNFTVRRGSVTVRR